MSTATEQTAPPTPQSDEPTKGLSQGRIVARKFFGHTAAVASIVVFLLVVIISVTSQGLGPIPGWWKWTYEQTPPLVNGGAPTWVLPFGFGEHPFGQDRVGRDLFAMTMRGTQISLFIMVTIGVLAGVVGIIVGSLAGFFRGWVEAVLMRITDVFIVIPTLIAAAIVGKAGGQGGVLLLGVFLGLVTWMLLARLVRAEFLSLREREFVDAARIAGASNSRIIFKHILPNTVGVITVNLTLLMSAAILTETALSYLGLGVRQPDISLGSLISINQAAFSTRPWLFWWPGLFIVIICLCINFIGDGLRDAFDPRQKKFSLRAIRRLSATTGAADAAAGSGRTVPVTGAESDDPVTARRHDGELYRGSPSAGGQNTRLELDDDGEPGRRD
ncbi:ABC transporter permease [Tersicoccus solisilvae]|uniref:ABC transporter permease n=1 Tax=Tersicoccus solisilvae TaxID=1882339 RepID=A0ABQ1P6U8_9MICC|nr:ABC transporter permease [Tersicoccus solisilvae]GGC91469.1 ABC transporter permease [Tersicoccus solisilvae]